MSTDKISVWEGEWKKGNTSFHLPNPNPKLLDNLDILLGRDDASESPKTVLVPLCGKTKDLIHLHSLGHNVVGVEWIEQACLEFFKENNLTYSKRPLEGVDGYLYTVSWINYKLGRAAMTINCFSPMTGGYECSNVISFT